MKAPFQHADGTKPFMVTRKTLKEIFASPRLVQRMISAGWFVVLQVGKPGREALYDYMSAVRAFERFKAGEEPPKKPSEQQVQAGGQLR